MLFFTETFIIFGVNVAELFDSAGVQDGFTGGSHKLASSSVWRREKVSMSSIIG